MYFILGNLYGDFGFIFSWRNIKLSYKLPTFSYYYWFFLSFWDTTFCIPLYPCSLFLLNTFIVYFLSLISFSLIIRGMSIKTLKNPFAISFF